ncbi:MAG: 5,10-methylene tetrahydromethanopterin reductase, partial [Clostridiales bacterium]|nr:5,10-methylene tetrahydromethanopterin reductase [Clostridiales bacterium]
MLITQLKSEDTIKALVKGKTVIINCHGCKEVSFPEHEAIELQEGLKAEGGVRAIVTTDYICH